MAIGLQAATLTEQLLNLSPVATEAEAARTLTDAYAVYAADAHAFGESILATGVALGKAAMPAALVGLSLPGAGVTALTAGIQAFWAAVATGLTTSFLGATAIVAPPHAGLTAALLPVFAANVASNLSKADAVAAIATVIHSQAIIGGTITVPPGSTFAIF